MGGDRSKRARKSSTTNSSRNRPPAASGVPIAKQRARERAQENPRSVDGGRAGRDADPAILRWWNGLRSRHRVFFALTSFLFLVVLGVAADAMSIYDAVASRFRSHQIAAMSGDVNVAVTRFTVFGSEDPRIAEPIARELTESLFTELAAELQAYRKDDFTVQTRHPATVGKISSPSATARTAQLQDVSRSLHADVVIGANIIIAANRTEVLPELYIDGENVQDAEELAGYHRLSSITGYGSPAGNPAVRRELRRALLQHVHGVTSFVLGLSLFNHGELQEANMQFVSALGSWVDNQDRALAYLFLGNTAGRSGNLAQARRYYSDAIEESPRYARAQLGLAELAYQEGRGACDQKSVKARSLLAALGLYRDVEGQVRQNRVLSLKATFGMGRVYLCLSQSGARDYWPEAEKAFRTVAVTSDESQRAQELASESYASLGLIYLPPERTRAPEVRFRQAEEAYRKAIGLSPSRERQALFYSMVGYIQEQLGDDMGACRSYADALEHDPGRAEYLASKRRLRSCR
jgi:tetratricopeptide (TPR) repeat protein